MIIYNITTKVEWSIHEEWFQWVKQEQIPAMLASQLFHKYQFVRLLQVDETDGPTYAIQFYANTMGDYNRYQQHESALQRQKVYEKWGDKIVDFRTVMEVVQ